MNSIKKKTKTQKAHNGNWNSSQANISWGPLWSKKPGPMVKAQTRKAGCKPTWISREEGNRIIVQLSSPFHYRTNWFSNYQKKKKNWFSILGLCQGNAEVLLPHSSIKVRTTHLVFIFIYTHTLMHVGLWWFCCKFKIVRVLCCELLFSVHKSFSVLLIWWMYSDNLLLIVQLIDVVLHTIIIKFIL